MNDPAPALSPDEAFAAARDHLSRAHDHQARLNYLWNSMLEPGPFSAWIEVPTPPTRELWCSFDPDPQLQTEADQVMADFFRSIKLAMDACVLAAATVVCQPIGRVTPDTHRMPLIRDQREFDTLTEHGQLLGLRPDQINTIRPIQPFSSQPDDPIVRDMQHLAQALEVASAGGQLFTAWVSEARPEPEVPAGVTIARTTIDNAGTLDAPKRLAAFELEEWDTAARFAGNPNVSFDLVGNAPPWPTDPDDNFATRSHRLLVITQHLIEAMERSVTTPYRADLLASLDQMMPERPNNTWHPVQFDDTTDDEKKARAAIAESDYGLATYLNGDRTLTYLRLGANGQILGREIADASDLLGDSPDGAAVEEATRATAGRWGLPDFVLRPKIFQKGSGIRELGDGTIISGPRGITIQVKARANADDSPDRAENWLRKNAARGLRQARGTVRSTLIDPSVELTNLRGRPITLRGSTISWVPVVVLDHPNPPLDLSLERDGMGPSVVILRRDWEFLWNQLRSASALVDYIHRVAGDEDPLELGAETHRYFELAHRDPTAQPTPPPDWALETNVAPTSLPLLPRDPAASSDEFGHAIFHRILEDIASTDFTGDESERIDVLSRIDRVAVASRASLGRLLLRRLTVCAEAAPEVHRMEHRIIYMENGDLQVAFTTMSQLTGYHQQIYRTWLLHRRQTFLERTATKGPIYPWTVGVLLTPRAHGGRPWDTTVMASNGPPAYDQQEFDRLSPLLTPNI
ncbi:hypothetical protein [Microlunatus sp. GCM10028923]|uniref:hypothetical protein n=1 Tax=Microlunatus sp. GCM10028923 TaxID=3273400 RepID=UPI00362063B9